MMVMLYLGRGNFSGRLRFFQEGFKFFLMGGDAFGIVWDFFWRGWGHFCGAEFVQGIWKISGEGRYFQGD